MLCLASGRARSSCLIFQQAISPKAVLQLIDRNHQHCVIDDGGCGDDVVIVAIIVDDDDDDDDGGGDDDDDGGGDDDVGLLHFNLRLVKQVSSSTGGNRRDDKRKHETGI